MLHLLALWLLALAPHSWATAPGVDRLEHQMAVHVQPGIDVRTVADAVADLDAGWTVDTAPPTYRPGEVIIEHGPTVSCGNDPADDQGCTRTVVHAGAVIWAQIDLAAPPSPWLARHELLHAAGCAHVTTWADVAHPGHTGPATYQAGDRACLHRLGA
jgi:hypothetical protein